MESPAPWKDGVGIARQAKDGELIGYAAEIRVRAERKCGELLADTPKAKGSTLAGKDSIGSPIVLPPNGVQTLSDLGISKRQSSEWQKSSPDLECYRLFYGDPACRRQLPAAGDGLL